MYMIEFAIWFAVIPCSFILIADLLLHSFNAGTLSACVSAIVAAPFMGVIIIGGIMAYMLIFKKLIDIIKMIFKN